MSCAKVSYATINGVTKALGKPPTGKRKAPSKSENMEAYSTSTGMSKMIQSHYRYKATTLLYCKSWQYFVERTASKIVK